MTGIQVSGPGFTKIEVETKVFKADGTLKSSETHSTEITGEQLTKLTQDGKITWRK